MKLARSAALAAALLGFAGAGAFACASKERKATGALEEDALAPREEKPTARAKPRPPPAPKDPFEGITGDASVGFEGAEQLLKEAIVGELVLPSFEVACVRGEDALETPSAVDGQIERLALEQQISLGRVRFVRIESDPSRGSASARLCRPVREDALLYAPLFREREPASRWLVEASADVPTALRALLSRAAAEQAKATAPPRAIVVRGKVVAVALPVTKNDG